MVAGVLCFLEIKLAKLTHYTVIAIHVFVIAHVFVQLTASVALSLSLLFLGSFIPYREMGYIQSGIHAMFMIV